MKKVNILFLFASLFLFYGCPFPIGDDEPFTLQESIYEPVIMNRSDFESQIQVTEDRPIVNSGKIYIKDSFLFINETNKGFHVFNNEDPSNPIKIAFIKALGATDLAIQGAVYYINNATDLIALQPNFSNFSFVVTKRIKDTFPQISSPDGFDLYDLSENEIIVDWILIN